MIKIALTFLTILFTLNVFALAPSPKLVELRKIGFVYNYQDTSGSINLSKMPSDYAFKDLSPEEVKNLDKAFEVKKEYGKFFGFDGWNVIKKEFINLETERTLLLEGSYKNDKGKLVSFIEVYWASLTDSGQFLITSDKQTLKLSSYKDYLVP